MRWKIIVCSLSSLFISLLAAAETHMLFWPYYPGLRYERGEEQELKGRSTFASAAGLLIDKYYGAVESERFETSSFEGNVAVNRAYQDLSFWGGYSLNEGAKWSLLGTAGIGFYKETIKTRVGSLEDSDTSKERNLFGLGLEWIFLEPATIFTFSFGGRMLWGQELDPSPQPQFLLKVGLKL